MVQLVRPSRGHITQFYGNTQPDGDPHAGQDYAYTNGVETFPEVYAAADGVVQFAGDSRTLGWPNPWYVNPDFNRADNWDSSAGNLITLRHNQFSADTGYGHLEKCFVEAGDTVKAGQIIGIAGETGNSRGKHLHFFLMFRPFNYATRTYGCADPNPYFVESLSYQGGTINRIELEDDELNKDQDAALGTVFSRTNLAPAAGLFASQGDINIVLARMGRLEDSLLSALGKPVTEPSAILVKGDQEPTVYAWDGGTGYRALDYAEFAALMASGAELRTVEQATIDGGK